MRHGFITPTAGCDIILMPENIEMAHQSLVTAVENGEIPKEQIEESVRKILTSKFNKGLLLNNIKFNH